MLSNTFILLRNRQAAVCSLLTLYSPESCECKSWGLLTPTYTPVCRCKMLVPQSDGKVKLLFQECPQEEKCGIFTCRAWHIHECVPFTLQTLVAHAPGITASEGEAKIYLQFNSHPRSLLYKRNFLLVQDKPISDISST